MAQELQNRLSDEQIRTYQTMKIQLKNLAADLRRASVMLITIRDQRLYREEYDSFDDFCRMELGFGKSRGYQLIAFHETVQNIAQESGPGEEEYVRRVDTPDTPEVQNKPRLIPINEKQTRHLQGLPADEQRSAWNRAVEGANGQQPTAKQVEAATILCERCKRIGVPVKDCPQCQMLRDERRPKPSRPPKPHPQPEAGPPLNALEMNGIHAAALCRDALDVIYETYGVAHDLAYQRIVLAGYDLDDMIVERARELRAGPEAQAEPKKPTMAIQTRFERFWVAYPRHDAKKHAQKMFNRINPGPELFAEIMAAVEEQKTWQGWKDGYIPHAGTWLNGERWKDEKPAPRSNGQAGPRRETEKERFDRIEREAAGG